MLPRQHGHAFKLESRLKAGLCDRQRYEERFVLSAPDNTVLLDGPILIGTMQSRNAQAFDILRFAMNNIVLQNAAFHGTRQQLDVLVELHLCVQ